MRITLFTEELRKCLNAAGLSDCGENDAWSYWYNRVLKAHNDAVERQVMTEQAENAKLREQTELLVTLLRNDCDIEVSWDGLRRFWSIELTEDGCLMRDRACKAEAENAKLRELVRDLAICACGKYCYGCPHQYDGCDRDQRLRELGIEVDG